MYKDLVVRRIVDAGALFLIGDGLMGLLRPRGHSLLWHCGPELTKAATEELAAHPKVARTVYFAELAFGLLLAFRQTPDAE